MPDFEASILGALVTASIFSTTFVSARTHEQRNLALERYLVLQDRIETLPANELNAPFAEQERLLTQARGDWFARWILALNVIFAALLFWLIGNFGVRVQFWPPLLVGSASLLAFLITEVAILVAGAGDYLIVDRELRIRLSEHPTHWANMARHDLLKAFNKPPLAISWSIDNRRIRKALNKAQMANVLSKGRHPYSLATLGMVEVAADYQEVAQSGVLKPVDHLQAAITAGYKTAEGLTALAHAQWQALSRDEAEQTLISAVELQTGGTLAALAVGGQVALTAWREQTLRATPLVAIYRDFLLHFSAYRRAFKDKNYDACTSLLVTCLIDRSLSTEWQKILADVADELLSGIEQDSAASTFERVSRAAYFAETLRDITSRNALLSEVVDRHSAGPIKDLLDQVTEETRSWSTRIRAGKTGSTGGDAPP